MTRLGKRLVEDFILPALNDQRFGDLLKWVDRENKCFSLRWSHKNSAKWALEETTVFQEWDKMKGRYKPENKGYYMQAKQRFRAALYKLTTVRPVEDTVLKKYKKYQLLLDPEKRKLDGVLKAKTLKNNRVSVIKKHSSSEVKSEPMFYDSPSPSTEYSDKSDCSEEFQDCIEDYKMGSKIRQTMMLGSINRYEHKVFKAQGIARIDAVPLKEVNDSLANVETSRELITHHDVAYRIGQQRHFCSPTLLRSPSLMVVSTYNEVPDYPPQVKEEYNEMEMDTSSNYALNLSTKSNDSLSR